MKVPIGCVLAAGALGLWAQNSSSESRAQFEVVSIKPSKTPGPAKNNRLPGGRYTATAMTVSWLIQIAYGVGKFQVSGPAWIDSEGFDINAKAERGPEPTSAQMLALIRNMLADRFQLVLKRETRDAPLYALVVDKRGAKLTESTLPAIEGNRVRVSPTELDFSGAQMGLLATQLSRTIDRAVVDRTGLTGMYDFKLHFAPENQPEAQGPSIFTAIQEQLGLHLESGRGPVEFLVVERVERPSEN